MEIDLVENAGKKKVALIVEDSLPDRILISKKLEEKWPGIEILTSSSVRQALQILANQDVNIIFLDLNLNDSLGPNTVREIRRYNKSVSIVVLTGLAERITVDECLKAGANHLCLKSKISSHEFFNILEDSIR